MLYSCQKNDSNDPASPDNPNTPGSPVSSEKQIKSVVFRSADNPSLTYDVSGVISSDTVKCLFALQTPINNLVPDISFWGKSISPASKTARDFTNPVPYTVTAEDGTTRKYIFSCATADSATMFVGKWGVIKDSSTNDGFVTYDGVYVYPGVYTGIPEDYWEFTSNGILNLHANGQTGNGFKYRFVSNAKLYVDIISSAFDDGRILALTFNKATFFWKKTDINGKSYSRMVYLKR
jgi:hypothetical protein